MWMRFSPLAAISLPEIMSEEPVSMERLSCSAVNVKPSYSNTEGSFLLQDTAARNTQSSSAVNRNKYFVCFIRLALHYFQ